MQKKLSYLSLSLLLVPTYFYSMNKKEELSNPEPFEMLTPTQSLTDSQLMRASQETQQAAAAQAQAEQTTTTTTSLSSSQPLVRTQSKPTLPDFAQSTVASRTTTVPTPTYESKGWGLSGFVNAFRDKTAIALAEIPYLEGKKPVNVTDIAHKFEWGINDTIEKITYIRTSNKAQTADIPDLGTIEGLKQAATIKAENTRKTADSLLTILRQERDHIQNLRAIITAANENEITLNEDILARAHVVLEISRNEALLYQAHALKESQCYLKEDKELRETVYSTKLIKHGLLVPSDDEYNDESICGHYLNVAGSMNFLDLK